MTNIENEQDNFALDPEAQYEIAYRELLYSIMEDNVIRDDRTGVGCASTFALGLRTDIDKHFPILSGRKMYEKIFNI